MRFKPDWHEAKRRLTALWYGERLDRLCIAITAPQPVADPIPVPHPPDLEAFWLDPAYRVPLSLRQIQSTWWGGESIPSSLLMANWILCLGGTPRFSPDTIWFETQNVDFSKPSPFRHDPDSPWTHKYRNLLTAMCRAAGRDDFLVSAGGGLPANDMLSMLMGTENFLIALMDHPEWMSEAIMDGAQDRLRVQREMRALVRDAGHEFWYGNAGWMPFWAPEPFNSTQSDVSCMLSPAMFDRFVLPELEMDGMEYGALWYHLDGGDARQHLPRLLSLPFLRVVQYVPAPFEPPNGPGHLPMYKEIQKAGKIVHVDVTEAYVEPLARELNPALLMLQTSCSSRDKGERLLEQCVKWSGGRRDI